MDRRTVKSQARGRGRRQSRRHAFNLPEPPMASGPVPPRGSIAAMVHFSEAIDIPRLRPRRQGCPLPGQLGEPDAATARAALPRGWLRHWSGLPGHRLAGASDRDAKDARFLISSRRAERGHREGRPATRIGRSNGPICRVLDLPGRDRDTKGARPGQIGEPSAVLSGDDAGARSASDQVRDPNGHVRRTDHPGETQAARRRRPVVHQTATQVRATWSTNAESGPTSTPDR